MKIERIQVEGGFLDDLDLSFSDGLNVIIGGRGTGKTSIIELVKYCLNARSYTDLSAIRSLEHAVAVLQDGEVTVTISTGKNEHLVSRTVDSPAPASPRYALPMVLSQTDVESLGLQATGRLGLIDSFRPGRGEGESAEQALNAAVQSSTAEMQQLTREIEVIDSQLANRPGLEDQLKELAAKEQNLAARSKTAKEKTAELQKVNRDLSELTVSSEAIGRSTKLLERFHQRIVEIVSIPPAIERWPAEGGGVDRLAPVRIALEQAIKKIIDVSQQIKDSIYAANSILESIDREKGPFEKRAREIRKTIEQLQEGAGATSRAASQVREQLAQIKALVSLRDEKIGRIANVQKQRGHQLDELDAISERRFKERNTVAIRISSQLGPRIRVKPIRAAQLAQYAGAVSVALRGSGLRYSELSGAIASRMSPRELVEIVEQGDSTSLAGLLQIQPDRAVKLITHLREHGTADVLTAHVEDDIRLELLDGTEYKKIENLSVGQRCTVILPIVLEHKDRVLVVDQPEDHLDNAFVVETLLKAILNRGFESQMLISTHNANLPVLGNAAQVVVMNSDGKRGFIEHRGDLEDPKVVRAITTIMEGGAEAFERRAQFYKSHLF